MSRQSQVKLLEQVKVEGRWVLAAALFDSKGRIRRDRVRVDGGEELHPEGGYFIEWWDHGKRSREAVGPDPWAAAEKVRIRQAELSAVRHGLIAPPEPAIAPDQGRITLDAALKQYIEYVRNHRSLRTFRTYRPILISFKSFCARTYVDQAERQDLLDYAKYCMKQGQKGKSICNKLVVLSQVMKQHGRRKLLNSSDWPSFVETIRPIYEDSELGEIVQGLQLERGDQI
jgi:integrase/recombinase XerD